MSNTSGQFERGWLFVRSRQRDVRKLLIRVEIDEHASMIGADPQMERGAALNVIEVDQQE